MGCFKVVTSPEETELVVNLSTERNSLMRTSTSATLAPVFFPWLTLVLTPTARNSCLHRENRVARRKTRRLRKGHQRNGCRQENREGGISIWCPEKAHRHRRLWSTLNLIRLINKLIF